jgi:murein DD-endopeptidase MepM/ murein hydrolase activator NlpD
MRRVEYVYNSATRSYERVEPTWRDWGIYAGVVFGLALLLLSLSVWMMDRYSITTPEQQALRVQNQGLARQLQWANEKLDRLLRQAEVLAERDQTFYRRFLRVEPLPEGVRQVGVGGSDSYRRFRREGTSVSPVLRRTGQKLDKLERQIRLQKASYRQLAETTVHRDRRLQQVPAIRPADGRIVSGYGMRNHPVLDRPKMHEGVDFPVRPGTPVVATGGGTVDQTTYSANYGRFISIRHPESGHETFYAHLSEIGEGIRPGQNVARGDTIGYSGSTGRTTGPHLHYEVRTLDGKTLNPLQFFVPDMTPERYRALEEHSQKNRAQFANTRPLERSGDGR